MPVDKPDPAEDGSGGERPGRQAPPSASGRVPVPKVVNQGAGFLLGLLAWGWIGLPLLRGGPEEVRDVLRAKFFNKAPDGTWLP
ncbi:hypothetical protein [Phytohabitans rumicis]|uniref:hypothetical protein n=1 Tax=Phytohabitans rumicis TaxID=1076125 RepID=UPI0015668B14|nr:hypothetical protein [Phytohabitans rumicis]